MNTTNSLSNTSLLYNRGGYSIKNDSVAISANRFQMLKSALIKLMLVIAIVVGGKVAWADSYTITFRTGSGDGTAASTSTACSTIVNEGAAYLSGNLATATKVYHSGSYGLKLGTSSATGTIKMNLSAAGQVTPTSIVVRAKLYNSSKSATLKVNGSATKSVSSSFSNLTFSITSPITYLQLESSKYIWIESIIVNYISSYTITAVSNDNSLGTVSLTENIITASHDACVYFETTAYTITSGTATVIQDGDNFIVSPSSNCTIQINFAEKPIYNITCNVNGIVSYSNSCEGTAIPAISIPSPTPSNCDGSKIFVGWSESEFEETDTWPTMIARNQLVGVPISDDKLYYAVFANANSNDAPLNTTLWSETWTGGGTSTPSAYGFSGTTVYNNASLTYTQTSPDATTKLWNENLAGGTAPELLLSKSNGTWTISNIPTGGAIEMSFTFKSNKTTFAVTSPTDDISISGSEKSWIITAEPTVTNFEIEIKNTGSQNARIDDIELKVTKINATAYTTFCPCAYDIDGISDGDLVWAGKNANADWNSTINWTRYNEGGYHLTATAPTSSNNVYIIEKAECEIDALPHINENTTCNNLTMFNGLGIDIAENKTLTINGAATFTNGVINGNVIFGSSATVSGASTSSHVDGIVTKSGTANGFTFPTGSNGNLGKVMVTDGTATDVSVQYFSNPAGFGTNDLPRWWNAADMSGENPFNHVSNVEYWKISSNEAITANFVAEASTDMHFNSETDEEDRIPANIQMAFYDNNRWTNVGGLASISDNTLTITGAEIPASATRGISGNYTTFGSKSKSTVLPIELTSFTANCNGRSALIEWTTATEKNNDFFVLERSHDAVNFKEIARIAGAGNSIEPISYAYTDYGVRNGDNYYRLIQFDYDGTSTASEIIVANCLGTDGEPEVLAYPNPFGDDLTLRFENFGNIQATVEVYDMLGRMVHTQKVNCSQNDYEVVLRLAGLSDGTYNVRISAKEFVLNRQVIKN